MSDKHPVWYEPHPVTPERKVELRAQGYVIVDAIFKPAEAEAAVSTARPPSEGLKVDELKAALEAKGVAWPEGAKKPDLAALLDAA